MLIEPSFHACCRTRIKFASLSLLDNLTEKLTGPGRFADPSYELVEGRVDEGRVGLEVRVYSTPDLLGRSRQRFS